MKNTNALITMALVSNNSDNPYDTFCEYVKYCVHVNESEVMSLKDIKEAVGKEFGIYIPNNVLCRCLSFVESDGYIQRFGPQYKRIGDYDIESFDKERENYKSTENSLIESLKRFVADYDLSWTTEYARELLIKVLDRNGLAYDIFLFERQSNDKNVTATDSSIIDDYLNDESEIEEQDENEPLFTDESFVGRFIEQVFKENGIQKDYLLKVCEGLMLCVGAYQLPTKDVTPAMPKIRGTLFFFDTKLLLRFLGCAGDAAVVAAKELVSMVQNLGGIICYYPQTLTEMEHAFDKAIREISTCNLPKDDDMRRYAIRINNSQTIINAKKASIKSELASFDIHLRQNEFFTDRERMRFGFELEDLKLYMRENLNWDTQVIDNDALSIWETHMRRNGSYTEYCGTEEKLPVFVTTNSNLLGVALSYSSERPNSNVGAWKQNRLPVITDIRLTCRLWNPAEQSERMTMLYLTANAVAAKRPTKKYVKCVRKVAQQLSEHIPEYSHISLTEYFDDTFTDVILKNTKGKEESLDVGSLATSITEVTDWKAKNEEEQKLKAVEERDSVMIKFENQTKSIVDSSINYYMKKMGFPGFLVRLLLYWHIIVGIICVAITATVSLLTGIWPIWLTIAVPVFVFFFEQFIKSQFVLKRLLRFVIPKVEKSFKKKIKKLLRECEKPYEHDIIEGAINENKLLRKCHYIMSQND